MKNKGITLVVLVVTIIILLILAGISIATLTGSGLFEKAREAEAKSKNAQNEENATLSQYESIMNEYLSGTAGSGETPKPTPTPEPDTKPFEAMPANSTVLENDPSKGIVIADSNGNEWTWVEVPKSIVFKNATAADQYNNIKTDLITYATTYREGKKDQGYNWQDRWYSGCGITSSTLYVEKYNKMLSSVYTNGGFWISRYEIGDSTATSENRTRVEGEGKTGTAVSKANQIPYNWVTCSQAQELADGMSTNTNKTSSLLFGIQWDLVCKYLEEKVEWKITETITAASSYLNLDSSSWGNYNKQVLTLDRGKYNTSPSSSTSVWKEYKVNTESYVTNKQKLASKSVLLTTGASDTAEKMNIYDFAGNVSEWTVEKSTYMSSSPGAFRGGYYGNTASVIPASNRSMAGTSHDDYDIGFRSTLY